MLALWFAGLSCAVGCAVEATVAQAPHPQEETDCCVALITSIALPSKSVETHSETSGIVSDSLPLAASCLEVPATLRDSLALNTGGTFQEAPPLRI